MTPDDDKAPIYHANSLTGDLAALQRHASSKSDVDETGRGRLKFDGSGEETATYKLLM
jgi:hypothetical protein